MLFEPAPTQFDLRFRLLGVPVRVHPAFWLFTAIFGWTYLQALGFAHFLLHMAVIFVSFLVHEMGHVLMGRVFGEWGYIVLGSFFGLAIGNYERLRRWQRIAVSFAGPAGNFLLVGLGVAYGMSVAPQWNWLNMSEVLGYLIFFPAIRPDAGPALQWSLWASYFLVFTNLFLGVLNLLPVYPLDGGKISRELCTAFSRRDGVRFSLGLSMVVAGLIAVYSVLHAARKEVPYPPLDPIFNAILFGLLAVGSWQLLQAQNYYRRDRDDHPW